VGGGGGGGGGGLGVGGLNGKDESAINVVEVKVGNTDSRRELKVNRSTGEETKWLGPHRSYKSVFFMRTITGKESKRNWGEGCTTFYGKGKVPNNCV